MIDPWVTQWGTTRPHAALSDALKMAEHPLNSKQKTEEVPKKMIRKVLQNYELGVLGKNF